MKKLALKSAVLSLITILSFSDCWAANLKWSQCLESARLALKENDTPYAIYKLRQAWLEVPNGPQHLRKREVIKDALITALSSSNFPTVRKEAEKLRAGQTSLEELDEMIRKRNSIKVSSRYKVRRKPDETLIFTPTYKSAGKQLLLCGNLEKSNQQNNRRPSIVVFKPDSAKYWELRQLCGHLAPEDEKNVTFDLSPFLPLEEPRIADI